jgi:predicted nuclease of predicted toxin-antitoxin system
LKFLVDAQLPKVLADWLVYQGFDAVHTINLPDKNKTDDEQIRTFANYEGRIVITKDRDFLDSYLLNRKPAKLILVKTGNLSNKDLLNLFRLHLAAMIQFLEFSSFIELNPTEIICHK